MRSALSIQCLPLAQTEREEVYRLVDEAIRVIEDSGLEYTVGPFETTVEGELEQVWKVARKAHQAVLEAQGDEAKVLSLIKVLSGEDIGSTSEKLANHQGESGEV